MDRAIKRDIRKRLRKITERYPNEVDKILVFTCESCGKVIKSRQIVEGIVPVGIECECGGNAFAYEEGDTLPDMPVTHEWYRPTADELMGMLNEHMFTVNFVLSGGLLRRPC